MTPSSNFIEFLFWKRFALRLGRAENYFAVYSSFQNLKSVFGEMLTPHHPQFLQSLNALFDQLEQQHLMLIGIERPTDSELRDQYLNHSSWQQAGYQFVPPSDADFPESFRMLQDPPRGIFVWGDPKVLSLNHLAVVGSREPTVSSIAWLEAELLQFLELQPGVGIASGGARGVDQCSHRMALRAGRPTLVFVPSGFQQLYPRDLSQWVDLVLRKGGAFVSEYEPGTRMQKSYFGERNRLISAVSKAVLVVEARRRSGTLLTARAAADQARAVFVLPGSPYDLQFMGSLDLLTEGATMIRDAQELSDFFRVEIKESYFDIHDTSTASVPPGLSP